MTWQHLEENNLDLVDDSHVAVRVGLTRHAQRRVRQRGIRESDAGFVLRHGTEIADGFVFTQKNEDEVVRQAKSLIRTARRLRGKCFVCDGGTIITAYHASDRQLHQKL